MKLNRFLISLVVLSASAMIAAAQTAVNPGDNSSSTLIAAAPVPAVPAPVAAPAPQDAGAANTNANTNATPPVDMGSTTNVAVPRDPNAIMPLISMEDVALTTAIKNLARQAGLNYILDPKIPYLGNGPDKAPEPTVSLRWENLTAEQALNAILVTYNLAIIDDPRTKIARIVVKDPAAPEPLVTRSYQLKYSDVTNIMIILQSIFQDKRSKVVTDVRTSQLVVVATERDLGSAEEMIARVDQPTKEVLIESKLVETEKNPTTSKGLDWTGTLKAQNIRSGNNPATLIPFNPGSPGIPPSITSVTSGGITTLFTNSGTAPTPATPEVLSRILDPTQSMLTANTSTGLYPYPFIFNADGVSTVLSFLNTEADAKVLSTPRTVTLDNQEAVLSVTEATPIFKTTAGTQGSPGGAEITYTNLGTILHVTPRISANNTINLHVIPELSSFARTDTKVVAGLTSQADVFTVRRMDTRVLIPSGNTLVMGGLVNDSQTRANTKVPIFGDIPGLGWLFRSEAKSQDKRNLIIFITPTIVGPEAFRPSTSASEFLSTPTPDKPIADFGAWDSGVPQDWSKLFRKESSTNTDDDLAFPNK